MKKSAALLFLLSCIVLSGCAATVKRPTAGAAPLAIPAVATTRIQLHVKGTPEMTASDDWTFFRTQWRTAMAEAAAAEGREFVWLDSLPSSFDGPGTLVVVTVTDYRYVSTGARYGLGVMTGNARAEAEATFHVLPEQRLAGMREYSTSSTAWQGIFSAMTPKQLAAIAAQMIRDIDARD